jgi:hypothetical protein
MQREPRVLLQARSAAARRDAHCKRCVRASANHSALETALPLHSMLKTDEQACQGAICMQGSHKNKLANGLIR